MARTAQSASAFAQGFFPAVTTTGPQADCWMGEQLDWIPTDASNSEQTIGGLSNPFKARGSTSSRTSNGNGRSPCFESRPGRTPASTSRAQAVAMSMSPLHTDALLRFFDVCPAYQVHEAKLERWMVSIFLAYSEIYEGLMYDVFSLH